MAHPLIRTPRQTLQRRLGTPAGLVGVGLATSLVVGAGVVGAGMATSSDPAPTPEPTQTANTATPEPTQTEKTATPEPEPTSQDPTQTTPAMPDYGETATRTITPGPDVHACTVTAVGGGDVYMVTSTGLDAEGYKHVSIEVTGNDEFRVKATSEDFVSTQYACRTTADGS